MVGLHEKPKFRGSVNSVVLEPLTEIYTELVQVVLGSGWQQANVFKSLFVPRHLPRSQERAARWRFR